MDHFMNLLDCAPSTPHWRQKQKGWGLLSNSIYERSTTGKHLSPPPVLLKVISWAELLATSMCPIQWAEETSLSCGTSQRTEAFAKPVYFLYTNEKNIYFINTRAR